MIMIIKLIAKADEHQKIKISVYRNEYDKEVIDPTMFRQDNLSKYPYREQEFECWELEKTFSQLLLASRKLMKIRFLKI